MKNTNMTRWMAALCVGLAAQAMAADAAPAAMTAPEPKAATAGVLPWEENAAQRDARMQWWRDAKFGMFIHYGIYSGLAGEFKGRRSGAEWIQTNLGLSSEEYAAEALPKFCPAPDCTEQWAELAKMAGCRYAVLTSKHHDGFGLFDSAETDYCTGKTINRDIVKEFVESFRKREMKVGLYHSVIDWHQKDYDNTIPSNLPYPGNQAKALKDAGIPRNQETYIKYLHAQVKELCTKYGPISILWWDYSNGQAEGERAWKARELMTMVHRLQPGIIMNNRLFAFNGLSADSDGTALEPSQGDFITPERRVPAAGFPNMDWESCMTVGNMWGYSVNDHHLKSPAVIISKLEECCAKGGNFLLNIGPKADGSVPEEIFNVFRRVGDWMQVNSEAVYGSRGVLDMPGMTGFSGADRVGKKMYCFLPAEAKGKPATLPATSETIGCRAVILGQPDCKVDVTQKGETLEFSIPASAWDNAVENLPVLRLSPAK